MIRFRYCGTHIKDEEYMNEMSFKGWNTRGLIEGFWKFEKGKENEYAYGYSFLKTFRAPKIFISVVVVKNKYV